MAVVVVTVEVVVAITVVVAIEGIAAASAEIILVVTVFSIFIEGLLQYTTNINPLCPIRPNAGL